MGRVRVWGYGMLLGVAVLGGATVAALEGMTVVLPRAYNAHVVTRPIEGAPTVLLTTWKGRTLHPSERILALDSVSLVGVDDPASLALEAVRGRGADSVVLTVQSLDSVRAPDPVRRLLHPVRKPSAAFGSGLGLLSLLMGGMGLLALGARAEGPAPRRFLLLCVAGSLPLVVVAVPGALTDFSSAPLEAVFGGGSPLLHRLNTWLPLVFIVWPIAFGYALLSLLYVFPTVESELRERFPMPEPGRSFKYGARIGLALAIPLTVLTRWHPGRETPWVWVWVGWILEEGLVAAGAIYILSWVPKTSRLVRGIVSARRRQATESGEVGRRAAIALWGIDVGARSFVAAIGILAAGVALEIVGQLALDPSVYARIQPELSSGSSTVLGLAILTALFMPFFGMGVAILRSGLWNVDLVAYRAILYSGLGVLFFLVWATVDQVIQALVPGGVAWAGPIVAALAVAALQGPLAQAIRRRIRPDAADFEELVERMAERLSGITAHGADVAQEVATVLAEGLRCAPAIALARDESGGWTVRGAAASHPSGIASDAAAVARALGRSTTALVRTDVGNLLAVRLGPVRDMAGMALVGARGGGRFYSAAERRLLSVMLGPVAPLLRRGREGAS